MFYDLDDSFVWECEQCGKQAMFKPHDFYACVAELRARQWSFHHDGEGWRHTCGYCNYKHRKTNIMDRRFHTVKGE
jgi:hypothetical protein